MLQASLKVVGGKHDGEMIPLAAPTFLIGRESDCQLRPNSDMISRHHCAFSVDDYSVRLRDLGSTNGTLVNGERIRGVVQLHAGDRVKVGNLEFEIQFAEGETTAQSTGDDVSALQSETAELSSEETHYEIPAFTPNPDQTNTGETTVAAPQQPQPGQPNPPAGQPAEPPPGAPPPQYPAAPPPGYPYPGQMPQQPGYYPPGMGYPPPGYYPQYPYPYPQPVVMAPPTHPPAEAAPAQEEQSEPLPQVRLPDPSTTGAGPQESQAADAQSEASSGESQPAEQEKKPSEYAADIIRRHLHRRPDLEE